MTNLGNRRFKITGKQWAGGLALLLALALLSACTAPGPGGVAAAGIGLDPAGPGYDIQPDPALAAAHNEFGFDLYRQLAGADDAEAGENVFLSPTSVSLALAMAYNGAREETAADMAQTLHWAGQDLAAVNEAHYALIKALQGAVQAEDSVQLRLANSLWQREGREFYDEFLESNRLYYGAKADSLPFDDPASVDTINQWVAEQTNGRLTDLLEEISPDDVMFLINAIYFQGDWTTPFDPNHTHPQPFHSPDGGETEIDMMHRQGDIAYLATDQFQAVRLPYGEGEHLAMYVLLPAEGESLASLRPALTAANWRQWSGEFEEGFGHIALPRFQLDYKQSLVPALTALGMDIAFDGQRADFGAMGPVADGANLYISDVQHQTFLRVDEKGSEAAGATSVEVSVTSMPLYDFTFRADRPFFVAIQEETTGALLFIGEVNKPAAAAE